MKTHLYLSLIPEALIASMLPPEKFGAYLAVGTRKRTHGEAIFFEVDQSFQSKFFKLNDLEKRCAPHADGQPKHTLYISVYRTLEHVPLDALKELYLTTMDGRVLQLSKKTELKPPSGELYLYQELAPVTPMIASNLEPKAFCRFVSDAKNSVFVPKLAFFDLNIGSLADDPLNASADELPYKNLDHLRDCLYGLLEHPDKPTKTVIRSLHCEILYRTVKTGFYVGDQTGILFYPFPDVEEMEQTHHAWWRSANTVTVE